MNFDECKKVVDEVLEAGFTALKIDLDIGAYGKYQSEVANFVKDPFNHTAGEWEHDRMVHLAEMVKTAAGKTVDVACDVHTRLDVTSAIRLARDLESLHLMWLEEPVPPENVAAMREVKRSTTTPICAGENLYLRQGFRDLLESQAVDIIMPDIPKCGGLSECRKIANMAEIYYMPFAPHNVASPIGTMASAHVCATVPNFLVLEFHWLHRDYWATITDGGEIIKDGYISARPTGPASGSSSTRRSRRRTSIPAPPGSNEQRVPRRRLSAGTPVPATSPRGRDDMTTTPDIPRPPKEWVAALQEIGAATASGTLGHMGVRSPFMVGPVARSPGKAVAGPALTLQCMPQARGHLQRGRIRRSGDPAPPPRALSHAAGRHRRGRCARRSQERHLRRHDAHLLQAARAASAS